MHRGHVLALAAICLASVAGPDAAQAKKPNILVIWGDDIGYWNLSHINRGMMGYQTPNIDRIAAEGLSFTDYYGQQSCTAGRAAFITGQIPRAHGKKFKVHLDGYDMLDYFKSGGEGEGPRTDIFYFTDVGQLAAIRRQDYKVHFMIQEAHGFDVWKNPYTPLGWPSVVDLRADPFERAMKESIGYGVWATRRMYVLSAAGVVATEFLSTFLDFPPRQAPGSFSVDGIIKQLEAARAGGK